MIDPLRLADSTDDEVVLALLRSAKRDEAPADTPARVAAAVGVTLPALATAALTKSAAAVSSAGGAGTWLGTFGAASTLKVATLSFLVTGATMGIVGVRYELEGSAPLRIHDSARVVDSARGGAPTPPSPERAGAVKPAPADAQGDALSSLHPAAMSSRTMPTAGGARSSVKNPAGLYPEATDPGAELGSAPVPSAPLPLGTAAFASAERIQSSSAGAAARPMTSPSQRLEREVAMLDAARRALSLGRASRALALLDRHRAEFSDGALYPESVILRVKALLALGQVAVAEREAQTILRVAPRSRAADALRALLHEHRAP